MQHIFYHYLVFQSLYSLLDVLIFHAPGVRYSFFMPYSLLWFLFSHFCWKLLLLIFAKIKHPFIVSVLMGIAVGYAPFIGAWLSFSRTFVFFPFFLAGYYFRSEMLPTALAAKIKWAGAVGTAALLLFAYVHPIDPKWLYSSFTFRELGFTAWYAGIYRLGVYVLEVFASLCFLSLVPLRRATMTEWGNHTVYVFLLHAIITKTAIATGIFAHIQSPLQIAAVFLMAGLLTWVLLQERIRRLSRPLIEPDLAFWERWTVSRHRM
ncbi:acyltransferase family protein [Paenibacillus hexagrammi]|uniref:Fucose 4-O-acetylase n=1 Tax=Paenibacillus hexagrammi TaxID=2908839 RepID=A0ABY3SKT2_9BACL|nr:fucose 4-O-acetylase [Paenibacillus sp. YPD9-1]UJF33834.1 fucose 4-O-acetylase [Paenibacillus sp. YPD9-1]